MCPINTKVTPKYLCLRSNPETAASLGLNNRGTYDRNRQPRPELLDQRLRQALGKGVGVGPSQLLGAPGARLGEIGPEPSDPVFPDLVFQGNCRELFPAGFLLSLPP